VLAILLIAGMAIGLPIGLVVGAELTGRGPAMAALWRSATTSLATTALDLATLGALVELFGVDYRIATFVGTVVGCASNFTINRSWSFEATAGKPQHQLARFLPVQAGASALHTAGVWLLTDASHLPYLGSKVVVAVAVYLGWNYPLNRRFVFALSAKQR
jgi:putative flippase GtrA